MEIREIRDSLELTRRGLRFEWPVGLGGMEQNQPARRVERPTGLQQRGRTLAEWLRDAKRHGRPWWDDNFVREISKLAGRNLEPRPRGRSQENDRSEAPIAEIVTAGR